MTKYHINSKGVPAICKAEKGNCPFGGDEQHFTNFEEAQEFANNVNQDRYGLFKNVDSEVKYEIPEGTPKIDRLDRDEFVENNHKLLKSGDNWVHIDNKENVIGTMKDPIAVYDNNGDLVEIVDLDNQSTKMSVQGLRAIKTLSKFNMVSKELMDTTSSINFYTPEKDMSELKEEVEQKESEADIRSFEAIQARVTAKGGHQTSDLFNKDTNDEMSNFLNNVSSQAEEEDKKAGKLTEAIPVDYNPRADNWEDLPSAQHFTSETWKKNNLDVQMMNNKWIVIDDKGQVYGRLDNPGAAVNFETESIELIGEYDDVYSKSELTKENKGLLEGNPSPLDKLGVVKFDSKNNNLSKVRKLMEFSWAFREQH